MRSKQNHAHDLSITAEGERQQPATKPKWKALCLLFKSKKYINDGHYKE